MKLPDRVEVGHQAYAVARLRRLRSRRTAFEAATDVILVGSIFWPVWSHVIEHRGLHSPLWFFAVIALTYGVQGARALFHRAEAGLVTIAAGNPTGLATPLALHRRRGSWRGAVATAIAVGLVGLYAWLLCRSAHIAIWHRSALFYTVFGVLAALVGAATLVPFRRSDDVGRIDEGGLQLSDVHVTVPWHWISSVSARSRDGLEITWLIRDAAKDDALRLSQQHPRRAARWIRFNPTVIRLDATFLRERPEEIVHASNEYIRAARAATIALLPVTDEGPHR